MLAASFIATAVGVFSYSLKFYQPQGRYVFPAQVAIAFFLALGFDSLVPAKAKPYMAAAIVIGLLLLNISALRVLFFWG